MMRISIKELHQRTLPEEKKKAVKIDFISYYLWRPLCDLISVVLINTNIKATTVTIFSFWMAFLAIPTFMFFPGIKGALLGYLLIWIWNIADGIDGNIARYKRTFSKKGDFWDAVAGYMAMVSFYFGAGIIAASEKSLVFPNLLDKKYYILLGGIAALSTIFPRLIVQKKSVVYGDKATESLKKKSNYGFLRKLVMNINSINGLAGLLLLFGIIFHITNIFIIFYGIFQFIFACGAIVITMKGLD